MVQRLTNFVFTRDNVNKKIAYQQNKVKPNILGIGEVTYCEQTQFLSNLARKYPPMHPVFIHCHLLKI